MMTEDTMEALIVLLLLVVGAFLLPARYDPAIRLKEWTERKRR
jgi:hypothetical protein